MKIKHVVYERREGLRWFFCDTTDRSVEYFISLYPSDIVYLLYGGLNILLPPFSRKHIHGTW